MSDTAVIPLETRDGVPLFRLTTGESTVIDELVDAAMVSFGASLVPDFLELALLAHHLPERLRRVATHFRLTGRPYGGFILSGLPVDETRVEPTPMSYTITDKDPYTVRMETLLLLIGSLIGDPFSFATQQRGRLVLDVFPIPGHEKRQLGTSSNVLLEWHNEDAFLADRPDWIILMGLRNPDKTATTLGLVDDLDLDPDVRRVLFEDRFVLLPDDSHTAALNSEIAGDEDPQHADTSFAAITAMSDTPEPTPILSGDRAAPFVRIDPAFMKFDLDDPEAEAALSAVITAINERLCDVVLEPGEMLLVDNKRAVHGRHPFTPRFDGTDRWLKRILITGDLRRSDGLRGGDHGRAVHRHHQSQP
ncbi:guanitoxin biosynthesis L-enduracididine beta-hydroxylase GntD [Stackebrandtia soli]|uniref:guanitoxin biosynthesis L-enduracididine beta-hydroxylase GntD n=1 Tax=Stackebrandtia soli TaxID=1892856 RepID=UPI0039EB7A95